MASKPKLGSKPPITSEEAVVEKMDIDAAEDGEIEIEKRSISTMSPVKRKTRNCQEVAVDPMVTFHFHLKVEAFNARRPQFVLQRASLLKTGLDRHLLQKCGIQTKSEVSEEEKESFISGISDSSLVGEPKLLVLRLISPIIE